ncbi:MAG: 1-hydroxycarotenoid 3,4-desaturase CrtD [Bacteroidota bacterium]
MHRKAIVIGSGIAGLATSIRLKMDGYEVKVFESNGYPGGKLHQVRTKGFRFDMGPSLFTMPWLVDELFQLSHRDPKDYFEYKRKETICNYFWDDGTTFSADADSKKFISEASRIFNESPEALQKYLDTNKSKYELTKSVFLEKSLHKSDTYLSSKTLRALSKIGTMGINKTLDQWNSSFFKNPKLIQFFNRFATYNGSSPYKTPGIMSMIPHLEMGLGTYFPKGGMHQITMSLFSLAEEIGVEFSFNNPVHKIVVENKRAVGVLSKLGIENASVMISNMDIYPTYKRLLPDQKAPEKVLKQERSSSALIFYWGVKRKFSQLDLHNIFFSNHYESEFEHIFDKKALHEDPTVYINISSKEEPQDAPKDCENWFVMINAPGNHGQDWEELKRQAKENILNKLGRILKQDIEGLITEEMVLDPISIEASTRSHRGALYGASSNSKFAAFLRHPNFSSKIKNLYFCGGSVHPGGGIPLCLLSAKIVSELVNAQDK